MSNAPQHHHGHPHGDAPASRDAQDDRPTGHADGGHDKHAGHSVAMFRDRFWIALALTIPTLVWGHMLQEALGYRAPALPGARWIPAVFGTAVFLYGGLVALATFTLADAVRPESREAVRSLHAAGIEVVMLTGDADAVAQAVARELEIDTVYAQVLPADKAARILELQRQGKRVAMVGEGVNDAPALVQADVGIAIGAGTDVAVEAGDVVLVRSDPRDVARIVMLSRATYRKMIQNLWWAAGYNIVAIPLAAGVLAPWGFVLSPAVGAVLMSLSTIVVAVNAQLLRRTRLA